MEKKTSGAVWEVDYGLEHTGRNDGRTATDGSQVWVHPRAFKNDWRLYHVVGHEYAHLKHIHLGDFSRWESTYRSKSAARAISEYRAYKWNVENQAFVPYSPKHFNKRFLFWKGKLPKGYRK